MARLALLLTALQLMASAASFVQQVFIARTLGATEQADGYQIAIALVLFMTQGLLIGPMINAFVPQLTDRLQSGSRDARAYAFWAQSNLIAISAVATLIVWVGAPLIIEVSAAGLSDVARAWAVDSLRLLGLSIPLAASAGLYSGLLYASDDLESVGVAQIIQNVIAAAFAIGGYQIVGFAAIPASMVAGLGIGTAIMWWRLHQRGLTPKRSAGDPPIGPGIILHVIAGPLTAPLVIALPGFVERWLMSFFPVGQIAILAYSGRIFSVALAFGVSVGLVALARWSSEGRADNPANQTAVSHSAVRAVLFAIVPATAVLIVVPDLAVRTLFEGSALDRDQLDLMALALGIYALGLIPTALVGIMLRGFYAAKDSRGALQATLVWMVLWILLDLALVPTHGLVGLAVASVAAVWIALLVMLRQWRERPWLASWPRILVSRETMGLVFASGVSALLLGATSRLAQQPWPLLALPIAGAAYLGIAWVGGSNLARDIVAAITRRHGK